MENLTIHERSNEMRGVYRVTRLFPRIEPCLTIVSFELSSDDWCELEQSEMWVKLEKHLGEIQSKNTRIYRSMAKRI